MQRSASLGLLDLGEDSFGFLADDLLSDRIFDNQHLLDATEIFRKLNVHKKARMANIWFPSLNIN